MIGSLGVTTPWLLLGLLALPILWFLLRAVPPAPVQRRFPAVALLLGLRDDETEAQKTPWWLLVLRTLAIAALILGFAGPTLNPEQQPDNDGPLLIVMDGTWASAQSWTDQTDKLKDLLTAAARQARPTNVLVLTDLDGASAALVEPQVWQARLPGLAPSPFVYDAEVANTLIPLLPPAAEVIWMSDRLDHPGRADVAAALTNVGPVTVIEPSTPLWALTAPVIEGETLVTQILRLDAARAAEVVLNIHGPDPVGIERVLATQSVALAAGQTAVSATLALPDEVRNRVTRISVAGTRHAGAVALTDDALRRREVGLLARGGTQEAAQLLDPNHFLREALSPTVDLVEAGMVDLLLANPDAILLADVDDVPFASDVVAWVEAGGLLVRFAGPVLAGSSVGRDGEDPLLPVRLRSGGRSLGGAMSWGDPKTLAPFAPDSPFFGLPVPTDVAVSAQVLAEPGPGLADSTLASLSDGTPLITRKSLGKGNVVLFHVTANAEWSSLSLSGIYMRLLERLAISTSLAPAVTELEGTMWTALRILDAWGAVVEPDLAISIDGPQLLRSPTAQMPPGIYAGAEQSIAVNVLAPDASLSRATYPAGIVVETLSGAAAVDLSAYLLSAALLLFAIDILAALALAGKLRGPVAAALLAAALMPREAQAQDDTEILRAASDLVLAYVRTGDPALDRITQAGMDGISQTIFARTSIEPVAPHALDLETDELSVYSFIYWPISPQQATPSVAAYAKLNQYLRSGGMILFDTRDAHIAGYGTGTPEGKKLQSLAAPLDIPPLAPIEPDHVLTRTFYLLQEFPGRHRQGTIWVEAPRKQVEQVEGLPFRNFNDGVSPVIIGGNDWVGAWARDTQGAPLLPVGRGFAGDRQREISYRFGINVMMYVLTGNYKSDQVHVPALLDRLGE